jgi:hypothetical protein
VAPAPSGVVKFLFTDVEGSTGRWEANAAALATVLDRLGRYESAAATAGFASTPCAEATYPELRTTTAHLRRVLGDHDYESLACKGDAMSIAEIAACTYDHIDQARAALNADLE